MTKGKKNKAEATLGENLRSYHIPAKLARLLNDRYLNKILSKYNIDPSTKSLDEKRSLVISEQNRLDATGLLKGWKGFKVLYFTEGRKERLCEAFIPEARDLIMKTPMCPTSERKARPRLDRFEDPNFVEPASSVESSKSSSRIPQSVTPKASQKSAAERSEQEQEQEHEEELEAEVEVEVEVEEGEPEVQTKDRYPSVIKTAPAAADAAATVSKAKERPAVPAAAKTATAGANTAAKTAPAPAVAAAAAATVSKAKERPAVPAAAKTATAGANTAATAVPAAATPAFVIKQKDVKAKQPAKPAGPAKPASDLAPAASSAGTHKPSTKPAAAYPTSPLDAEFSQPTPQVKVTKAAVVINNNTGSNKGTTRNVKAGNKKIPATTTKTEPTPVNIMRGQGGPPKSAHSGLVHPEADSGDDQEPNVDSLVEDVPTNHGDPDEKEEVEQQLDGRDDGDGEDSDGDLRMDDGDADDFLLHERNLSDSDSDYEVYAADETVERDGDAVLPDAHDVFDVSSSEEDGGLPGSESPLPAHLRYQSMKQDQAQYEPSTPFETYLSDRLDTLESFIMQLGVKSDNIFVKLSKRTYAKSIKNNNFGDKNNNKKNNKINACLENFASARPGDDAKVVKGRGNKKTKAIPKSKEKEKEKQKESPTSARKDAKPQAHLH